MISCADDALRELGMAQLGGVPTATWEEALTNVLRHAPGATADVTIAVGPDVVRVEVADDGLGGDPGGRGYGLTGLQDRVSCVDGSLVTGRRPGGGFLVAATLPVHAKLGR